MSWLDGVLGLSTLAGIGVALAAAPLGCFVVWRRMAYFGDATAHASLLGVALALAMDVPVFAGAVLIAAAMAVAISTLASRRLPVDTLLGVLSHSALAIGLVAAALVPGVRVDLGIYLFGDILAVYPSDVALIWAGAAAILGLLLWRWSDLLTATLNPDLALSSGISPRAQTLTLTLTLALLVAVAIKVVGVLLIVALLLIPAATARAFAATPERMAGIAALIGIASAVLGLRLSLWLDSDPGPSIVCVAAAIFALSRAVPHRA